MMSSSFARIRKNSGVPDDVIVNNRIIGSDTRSKESSFVFLHGYHSTQSMIRKAKMTRNKLIVLSSVPPPLPKHQQPSPSSTGESEASSSLPVDTNKEYVLDQMDDFNHPRQRRDIILTALQQAQSEESTSIDIIFDIPTANENDRTTGNTDASTMFHNVYSTVHSTPLLNFFEMAWKKWLDLGNEGRDPIGSYSHTGSPGNTDKNGTDTYTDSGSNTNIPYLIPACTPLLIRCGQNTTTISKIKQRKSQHVIGQISYYCTDTCTPIFHTLLHELYHDTILIQTCLNRIHAETKNQTSSNEASDGYIHTHSVYYIIPNHPGHHAAQDCFGGYCYVNHIAALAKNLSDREKVVILDIDYHCGNGTAAIFQQQFDESTVTIGSNDESNKHVMVISIHCDPNYDYPFHMGFAEDSTANIIHIPLSPGTGWNNGYRTALLQAIEHINSFQPSTLLISLGIDTYENDPCTIRRAGFSLQHSDYNEIGILLATEGAANGAVKRTIFVQEGGYRMDVIGSAAKNVVVSYTQHIKKT